jgi:hypothetical protein
MSWKTHYLEVCEINAWPNIRRVREARAAMTEKAARHTTDIVPVYFPDLAAVPPVLVTTWQDLMARYHKKFMPAAAGVYSRAEYNIAKPILSEDVGGWHARLRDLYNQVERKGLFNKLKALASGNKYALCNIYGPGFQIYLAGSVAYVTQCLPGRPASTTKQTSLSRSQRRSDRRNRGT